MRKKIIIIAAAITVVCALIGCSISLYILSIPRELTEYKVTQKWGADGYTHIAAYMNSDASFTANAMAKSVSEIESAYTVDSIELTSSRYSASLETNVSLTSPNSSRSASCAATVYLGDYFVFHPYNIIEGAYPVIQGNSTDAVLIDELAAWQLFGTQRGVVGLEAKIGNDYYTVCGVIGIPDGVYNEVYGEKPRVYINADSAAYRSGSASRAFTTFEAIVPDPITNYAENALTDILESFDPVIKNIDTRFNSEALKEVYESQTSMIIDPKDREYPYTEKAMLILSLKASDANEIRGVMFKTSLVAVAILFFALFGPCVRFIERLLKKIKF